MATEITPDLQKVLNESHGAPVQLVDPASHQQYVILRAEFFERIKNLLDFSEPTAEESTSLLQQMGKSAGWEDPSSDSLI
jgi:hypothetical protein